MERVSERDGKKWCQWSEVAVGWLANWLAATQRGREQSSMLEKITFPLRKSPKMTGKQLLKAGSCERPTHLPSPPLSGG